MPEVNTNRMSAQEFKRLHGSAFGNQAVNRNPNFERFVPPEKKPKAGIRLPKTPTPTKAEVEYGRILKAEFPECNIHYEAITFRMEAGNYCPDWTIWYSDRLVMAVEVKGSYRLHSAGRSHMAFKAARAAWPAIRFRFAQFKGGQWAITE